MPKISRELSAIAVANLKQNGRYMVGGAVGLHLRVAFESRSWILRATVNGKRCDIGLGSYPGVTLATARKLANKHHDDIANGVDPIGAKRAKASAQREERAKAKTFEQCAELYFAAQAKKWDKANPKHVAQWKSTLENYAYPVLGKMPVAAIDTDHVLAVIEPLWATKTETASRLRGRIEKILGWAAFQKLRSVENPARWANHLATHLPMRSEVAPVIHHASLPYHDLGAFMVDLRKRDGISARALEFAILCCSRSGEVRGATWAEFDLDRALWKIPADRMKAGIEHVVPLSAPAVALLRAQAALPVLAGVEGPRYVFPAPRGGALSDAAFKAVLKRMDRGDLTQHGFRSTFREWAGEVSKHPREVVEHALAHQLADKAEAAYQRGSLLPKRVVLMADWAKFCAMVPTGIASIARLDQAA